MTRTNRERVGILSVPWVGIPPRGQGSIAGKTDRITQLLAEEYDFTIVSGPTGRAPDREHSAIRYVQIDDRTDRYLDRSVRVLNRARGRRRHFYHQVPYHPLYARRGAAELAEAGCTTVIVHEFPQWVPIVRRALPGARVILWGGADSFIEVDSLLGYVRRADALIAASASIARRFTARVPELRDQTYVVYSGVDTSRFRPPDADQAPEQAPVGKDSDAPQRVVFAGRLTPEKGVHVLVEAFGLLADRYPRLELELVGPKWVTDPSMLQGTHPRHLEQVTTLAQGDYVAELRNRAGPRAARVHMTGPRTGDELVRCLQEATIFCHPVLCEEGFGTVVAEALACGTPVVISDLGGPPEYVSPGASGLVVPSGDSAALAAAIATLLDDPDLRASMSRSALRIAASRLDSEHSADALRAVLAGEARPMGAREP